MFSKETLRGLVLGIIVTGMVLIPVKFFVDGRLDTRPLSSQDIPHEGLPYLSIGWIKSVTAGGINDGEGKDMASDHNTWGTDLDFYLKTVSIYIESASEAFLTENDAFNVLISANGRSFYRGAVFDVKMYEISETWYLDYQVPLTKDFKVLSTEFLSVTLNNYSGVNWTDARSYITGVASSS